MPNFSGCTVVRHCSCVVLIWAWYSTDEWLKTDVFSSLVSAHTQLSVNWHAQTPQPLLMALQGWAIAVCRSETEAWKCIFPVIIPANRFYETIFKLWSVTFYLFTRLCKMNLLMDVIYTLLKTSNLPLQRLHGLFW